MVFFRIFDYHLAYAKQYPPTMTRRSPPKTPLLTVLRQLGDKERRDEFAALAGTSRLYLYQLAICSRRSCRADLAKRIADASVIMNTLYGSDVLTLEGLSVMCAECQIGD